MMCQSRNKSVTCHIPRWQDNSLLSCQLLKMTKTDLTIKILLWNLSPYILPIQNFSIAIYPSHKIASYLTVTCIQKPFLVFIFMVYIVPLSIYIVEPMKNNRTVIKCSNGGVILITSCSCDGDGAR